MADLARLIRVLDSYSGQLERHNAEIGKAYQQLEHSLSVLSSVYEGVAATEFKNHWARTRQGLKEYNDGVRSIRLVLEERLAALKEADRPDGL
jgi:uncharacterized protein YukE